MQQRVIGWLVSAGVACLLVAASLPPASAVEAATQSLVVAVAPGEPISPLPLLTNAAQVKRLQRDEAVRRYPVRIRGVITCVQPQFNGFVLQDATWGVYVKYPDSQETRFLQPGEECEVEGVTDALFSPTIRSTRVMSHGTGTLPEPLRPTWNQLLRSSLDTLYVELQGLVTAYQDDGLSLLMPNGVIKVHLPELKPESYTSYGGSLVNLRGCLFARHGDHTVSLRYKVGEVELHNVLFKVLEPSPRDVFTSPKKSVADLYAYDAEIEPFQWVRVDGQIAHERQGEYFLIEGGNGLRFFPKAESELRVGDLAEVAGLLQLGGPSPVLLEAVARKTGRSVLPPPRELPPEDLLVEENDSTLVRIEGVLVSQRHTLRGEVFEAQAGMIAFEAWLSEKNPPMPAIPVGSRLQFTGVLAGKGGNRMTGSHLTSIDVLINSSDDIRILARPTWWTARRLLFLTIVLAGGLAAAVVWIRLLRRQVEHRTAQLKQEIHEREQAEHQRALEAERSRIARDLHDDLGSSMTEISMLAETGRDRPVAAEDRARQFDRILTRARQIVAKLDEIVWAVDPRKDNLRALTRYLAGFAEEYVSAAGLVCRVEMPPSIPEVPLEARLRYQLFLAVKEAIHNAVRHAQASQVSFQIEMVDRDLKLMIQDDGRGFDPLDPALGDGLGNLRTRMDSAGGGCEIQSVAGQGTTILLTLRLASKPSIS